MSRFVATVRGGRGIDNKTTEIIKTHNGKFYMLKSAVGDLVEIKESDIIK